MKRNRVTRVFIPGRKDFRLLMNACKQSDEMIVNNFLILMMGMLGLRIGEIIHLKKTWVDFEREMITIPPHEPCNCDYCIKCMKRKVKCKNITPQEVTKECWKPKTEAGARSIPFGFDPEVREVLEKFMTKFKKCPLTLRQIQYRIKRIGKLAGLPHIHPHAPSCLCNHQVCVRWCQYCNVADGNGLERPVNCGYIHQAVRSIGTKGV